MGGVVTRERLAFLRGPMGGGRMLAAEECRELADAYEEMSLVARTGWDAALNIARIEGRVDDAQMSEIWVRALSEMA